MDDSKLDPAEDPGIDRRTRTFLRVVNRDNTAFWELPGDQPQRVVTALQERTPVDLSGVTISKQEITSHERPITLYAVRPAADCAAVNCGGAPGEPAGFAFAVAGCATFGAAVTGVPPVYLNTRIAPGSCILRVVGECQKRQAQSPLTLLVWAKVR